MVLFQHALVENVVTENDLVWRAKHQFNLLYNQTSIAELSVHICSCVLLEVVESQNWCVANYLLA
jgi:hypothetical protein